MWLEGAGKRTLSSWLRAVAWSLTTGPAPGTHVAAGPGQGGVTQGAEPDAG